MKWGDVNDDGDEQEMPGGSSQIFTTMGQDGIKTITEFTMDDDDRKIKIVRKVRETRTIKRVHKDVAERRKWTKFGDSAGAGPGPESATTVVGEKPIYLKLKPTTREDLQQEEEDAIGKQLEGRTSIVVCRFCGEEGHFSLRCPKRDEIQAKGVMDAPASRSSTGEVEKWVPAHRRNGGTSAEGQRGTSERDDFSLRVTNISEDTTDDDLRELFRRFGHTTRIYLAKDYNTGVSRGFAFVSFSSERDAQSAIDALNGHGYDNLILNVEWASKDRPGAGKSSAGSTGAGKPGWTMRGTK